jgi:hypothetical protein
MSNGFGSSNEKIEEKKKKDCEAKKAQKKKRNLWQIFFEDSNP